MRAIFTTLSAILISLNLGAQTAENQHLLFKGVPIDGTMNEYVAKMKLNGFVVIATEPGATMLQGEFASSKPRPLMICKSHSNRPQPKRPVHTRQISTHLQHIGMKIGLFR
jgi:hypothetical protein